MTEDLYEALSVNFHSWEEAFDTCGRSNATMMVPLEAFIKDEREIVEAAVRHGFKRVLDTEDEAMYVQVH